MPRRKEPWTIRKRKGSIYWMVDFYLPGKKRVRRSTDTTDATAARARAHVLYKKITGHDLPSSAAGVSEFERQYIEHMKTRLRPRTVQAHQLAWKHLIAFRPIRSLSDVTVRDVEQFMDWLRQGDKKAGRKGIEPISVNTHVRMLRQIFGQALVWHYVTENPFRQVKLLKYQQKEPRPITRREIKVILSYAATRFPKYVDLFRFYLLTGMRLSEPLELTWDNVRWEEQLITLNKTKTKHNRRIPLLPATRKILEARLNAGESRPFALDARRVRRVFQTICKDKYILDASIQNLRSSVFSYMVSIGVPSQLIYKIIGHTSETIGQMHYFKMPIDEVIRDTAALQDLIGNPD